jgi:hypothetical protein
MESELGGSPDQLHGLVGVGDAGQFEDDPSVTGYLQRRFGHTERVDPATQNFKCSLGDIGVNLDFSRVLSLEDDLSATPEVEPQMDRCLQNGEHRRTDSNDREKQPPL